MKPVFLPVECQFSSFFSVSHVNPQFVPNWQIYDYMNVQSIHNSTFASRLPPTFLSQARALANYHEYGVFTDSSLNGIGNSEYTITSSFRLQAHV